MTMPPRPEFNAEPPFLGTDPPHWAARGLSTVLIALFTTALIAAVAVRVPETVRGAFVLVPEHGADPVRASREGTVTEVRVDEGDAVKKGATLFVVRSEAVGDRAAEMRALEMQSTGASGRMTNAVAEYESQKRADVLERRRLENKLASLARITALKRKQLTVTREMADRSKRGQQSGAIGGWESDRLVLEADRLAADVESTQAEQEETRASLSKLLQDAATRDVRHRELVRSLAQEEAMARDRLASRHQQPSGAAGDLVVTAPCAGTVLRMMVSTIGAIVQPGEALGEVACSGSRLQVEMSLGQSEVARVRQGQGAKLLYDAFPYQRFGVKFGRVRWVGPATAGRTASASSKEEAFRALIDASDSAVMVSGEPRPLLVGMRGNAKVMVGQRSLISYAFEPIRALRENFSRPPATIPAVAPPAAARPAS